MRIFTLLAVLLILTSLSFGQTSIDVEDNIDFILALNFAEATPSVDTLFLVTSGGVYTTIDSLWIRKPLVIMAKPGLAEKPIMTNSDEDQTSDDIFRVYDDFTLIGVALDGGHALTHGPKYGVRLRHSEGEDSVKMGTNITLKDCDFYNFFEDKDPLSDGHGFNIQVNVKAGDVLIENCTFKDFGYEAIRISDTEKWVTDAALASLTIRNCSFTNIDAECIRYYSDLDAATPDPPVLIEHLTIDNSATRIMFLKNSGGAHVRDIIITNSRMSGHGRDADLFDAQGNTDIPSFVSHIDTFNVKPVPIKSSDGEVDTTTIYGFDPLYADAENFDYTLAANSPAYGKAFSGVALGDLRWADPANSVKSFSGQNVPELFSLNQNYPNPFNPVTTISYSLSQPGNVVLVVYDITGKTVATLVDTKQSAGTYQVDWQPANQATGVYFYRLNYDNQSVVKKMMLIR